MKWDPKDIDQTFVHQEFSEGGLELGLTRLEIVTPNEGTLALRELNNTRNEGRSGELH